MVGNFSITFRKNVEHYHDGKYYDRNKYTMIDNISLGDDILVESTPSSYKCLITEDPKPAWNGLKINISLEYSDNYEGGARQISYSSSVTGVDGYSPTFKFIEDTCINIPFKIMPSTTKYYSKLKTISSIIQRV